MNERTPDKQPTPPGLPLSVIICTYNRAGDLERALQSLVDQTHPHDAFEVLVVDNNSTDDTQRVIESFRARLPHLTASIEPHQGLSHARNRGWREARGRYVGYLDDDAIAPPEWLATAADLIERHSPAMLGGPFYPYYADPKPTWFKDDYGSRENAEAARPLRAGEHLSGGNMFLRADLLARLGGYDPAYGMAGERIAYGEENVLQDRLRVLDPGACIYYDPRLAIRHRVRPEKMRLAWRLRQAVASGRDVQRARRQAGERVGRAQSLLLLLRALARLVYYGTWRLLLRDRRRFPFLRQYVYEVIFYRLKEIVECWLRLREGAG